jgi:hypothetical protein
VAEAEPFDSEEEDGEEGSSDYEGEEGEERGRGGFGGIPPEILRMMMMRGGVGGKGGPPREDPNVVHARRVREGLQELCRGVSPVVEGDRVGKSTREEDMVAVLGSTEVAVDFIPAFIERLHKVHGGGGGGDGGGVHGENREGRGRERVVNTWYAPNPPIPP